MGKAKRWFKALLGAKKPSNSLLPSNGPPTPPSTYGQPLDANKHAIAVAAATAAVAEAALAAAQAAAEVVRLTSAGSRAATAYVTNRHRELAAVKIQSAFRAYLARRALRALKGLVKLQALVRGHIVRKQSTDMLRRMQTMARIQVRACANRAYMSDSPHSSSKSSHSHHPGFGTPTIFDHQLRAYIAKHDGLSFQRCGSKSDITDNVVPERADLGSNWFDSWMEETSRNGPRETLLKNGRADDEKSDKILEIDTWKPHLNPKRKGTAFQTSRHVSAWDKHEQSFTPFETLSRQTTKSQKPNTALPIGQFFPFRSLKYPEEVDEADLWAAENSPQVHSVSSRPGSSSSRRGPFTPSRNEYSRSLFGDYPSYPNYMANTESSRAKFRSHSAPRQRMELEKPGSTKMLVRGLWDADTISEKGLSLHANLRSKAYPGSAYATR